MPGLVPALLALVVQVALMTLLWRRPWLLRALALAGCALPFFLPLSEPPLRFVAAILVCLLLVKALQFAADHVPLRNRTDFLIFLTTLAVVRWQNPRRPDSRRALFVFLTGLCQAGLLALLALAVSRLDAPGDVRLFATELGLYFAVAAWANFTTVKLCLRGLDHDDPFNHPLSALSPAEFWSRRWNTYISDLLHRYIFAPAGGRRHPARGLAATFAVSGAVHELLCFCATLRFNGGMLAFFFSQGALVIATSRSRVFRRITRRSPRLAWMLTIVLLSATGILFVRGLDGIDPSGAWRHAFPRG